MAVVEVEEETALELVVDLAAAVRLILSAVGAHVSNGKMHQYAKAFSFSFFLSKLKPLTFCSTTDEESKNCR